MAPQKWTSSKQEEWLSPWYEKYCKKQSDKAKNWANFFTNLVGEWLEVFPEPRPTTLPLIGPLTRDKIIVMDQAEADRKKKLENCFKNSLGAIKTGRQARAEATNIFSAVLKSVTEGKKPMHSLQEVEAYSKLYYQRCIKSIVNNKLKAEAEALQAKNKALTNGMRVAIIKKETANLYKVETNEVKVEVWRYIEDAKMCKDNEKVGMWSEDDYKKNLEKLAAMVNKFLKGLADVTGFLFSLLAGGPSPELADAAPSLKAKAGGVEDLNDGDGGDCVELGNQHESHNIIFSHVTSSSLTTAPLDSVPDTSKSDLPGNSTDIWQDDFFWEGLTTQVDGFAMSGGNPDLLLLPPYPHSPASALNSPSSPTTLPLSSPSLPTDTFPGASVLPPNESPTHPSISSSQLPADTFPEVSTLPPNESVCIVPQSSPAPPSTTLPPTPALHPHRTGRVCVPSLHNVIANSIGNDHNAGKHCGVAVETGVSGHKKRSVNKIF
ncbi:uncharacterized protein BJ212DRAFT_1487736 [Suillus subaureus]|uniref:Uncharacterized protein n=1 Tax=Suillus subaureus TaxID=48587 RepID=A0A9P7DRK6_9AGAM|nr:uncharacterized protein BJ212DRAFT_1487736 [Suillus subaureus]KAG1801197.1 hypothetical protein BJ212DRAFT_1487736 [Suillus subaureus]